CVSRARPGLWGARGVTSSPTRRTESGRARLPAGSTKLAKTGNPASRRPFSYGSAQPLILRREENPNRQLPVQTPPARPLSSISFHRVRTLVRERSCVRQAVPFCFSDGGTA